jgi:hypothetical protein
LNKFLISITEINGDESDGISAGAGNDQCGGRKIVAHSFRGAIQVIAQPG